MPELSPSQAALIAHRVYALRPDTATIQEERELGFSFGTEDMFALEESSRFRGQTGALAWKTLSGFGYVAPGIRDFDREALVATRGTDIPLDWLVNLNIGMRLGPAGLPVHAGFLTTWHSFQDRLAEFIRSQRPRVVHCVGHSLGGALATLTADWLSAEGWAEVKLYTFGSPRVGDATFSLALTRRIGAANIYRVHHPADVVTMIPMLPFFHVPMPGDSIPLPTGSGALISVAAHSMPESYIPGLAGRTWQGLRTGSGPGPNDGVEIKGWLEAAAEGKGSFVMGSARLLAMIGRALTWLVRKAFYAIGSAYGSRVTAGLTLLDALAWLLSKAAQLAGEIAGHIKTLLRAILGFLGRTAVGVGDVTMAFVRWLLATLVTVVGSFARRAMAMLGR